MELQESFDWCKAERKYHSQFNKGVDWGLVNTSPYDNTTYSYYGYQATNWNEKPIADRIRILVDLRKGQSMMGRYRNPPFAPYPTIYNYRDRVFKRVMDNIQGAGQYLDIPWKDYVGVTHTIKLKEK
tara:strand:+ start:1362 stop:1742 length:381 start_codon:yes stop_codon:yes gene_type:complete